MIVWVWNLQFPIQLTIFLIISFYIIRWHPSSFTNQRETTGATEEEIARKKIPIMMKRVKNVQSWCSEEDDNKV